MNLSTRRAQAGAAEVVAAGADQEQQISEREKEIIAATFNQVNGDAKAKAAAADNGKYLSEVQAKLRDQAQSLANRTKARQLDGSGAGFAQFVKEMELAVASMSPASDKLKGLSFQDALTPEQQALQHLLRAENTFRQIQVQVSRGGGGGGGGGGGAGRDLANLFDLELDKDKNQYETNASSSAEQKQQEVDERSRNCGPRAQAAAAGRTAAEQSPATRPAAIPAGNAAPRSGGAEAANGIAPARRSGPTAAQQGQQQGQQSQGQSSGQGQQSASSSGGQQGQQQQSQSQQQAGLSRQMKNQLDQAIKDLAQAEKDMSNSASARQPGQQKVAPRDSPTRSARPRA